MTPSIRDSVIPYFRGSVTPQSPHPSSVFSVFPSVGFNHPGGMTSVMPLAVKLALKDKDVTLGIKARQER